MGEVVQFPSSKITNPPKTRLERGLNELQKMLKMRHRLIKECTQKLLQLEQSAKQAQVEYDKKLLEYSERIGPENVPLKYIDYSTNVVYEVNNEGFTVSLNTDDPDVA